LILFFLFESWKYWANGTINLIKIKSKFIMTEWFGDAASWLVIFEAAIYN
jgi:hypothetical protein